MSKEMLINVSEGEECRIALLQDGRIGEFYIERTSSTSHVGNIYKGRVVNVEPSIQAAFVDFGLGRNGFLHISDLLPSYFGRRGEDVTESVGRKLARRDRPPIQRCLRRGDEIIVQIIKEGIGTKGPTLTTYLSIPGRILVMMPGMSKMGVSRKIEDDAERKRLRQILDGLEPPEDCGFIIRTAGVERSKADIQRDLAYLTRLWQQVNKKMASGPGPMTLYTEGDLVTRTVRDIFSGEIDHIIIDNERVANQVRDFIKLTSPRAKDKVELYQEKLPLFHKYNIEKEIEMMYSRHVPLPSGGSLVIDQTEAIVAIDVNSGKFRDHSDAETTAFKTDMEAAEEIPRQLKLRDMGGVIICDFIDLRYERHRRELERKLHENFKDDRAKTKVLRMSQFGIIELTRQRMRPSVKRSIYCDCPHCRGSGLVKTPESMSLDVMRKLAIATHDQRVVRVELTVHADVASYLNNRKRAQLSDLEHATKKRIIIKVNDTLPLDEVKFDLFDSRDGIVNLPDLLPQAPQSIQEAQMMAKQSRQRDRGRPHDRRGGRHEEHEDRFEIEEMEESEHREDRGGHPDHEEHAQVEEGDEIGEAPLPIEAHEPNEFDTGEEQVAEEGPEQEAPIQAQGGRREGEDRQEMPHRAAPPRPQGPSYAEMQRQGGYGEEQGGGRRRRRGRRGRGRGRFMQEQNGQAHDQREPVQSGRGNEDVFEHLPPGVWIQMPGEEDAPQPDLAKTPSQVASAVREQQSAAQQAPQQPKPVAEPPRPVVPAEPVRMAPIAEWPEEKPVIRKPVVKVEAPPVAAEDEAAGAKGKGRKKVAGKKKEAAPKKGAKGRGKRKIAVDEGDVSVGNDVEEPTSRIAEIAEEPKVRIADDPIATRNGDRHLATDEPVDPEAIRRVNTRRDLDHVPEDIE